MLGFSVVVILLSASVSAQVKPPQSETEALLDLYQLNGGPYWNCSNENFAPWNIENIVNDPCKLYGVRCIMIQKQCHIIDLELPQCGLTGTLQPSFSGLLQLIHLDLSYNFQYPPTTMPFPNELKPLMQLELIRLNNVGLNGSIPDWIFDGFVNLQYLDVSQNNLTGKIPSTIGYAADLRLLDIHSNRYFGGVIPMELYELTYLKTFIFYNTNITGSIKSTYIRMMVNLEILLGGNSQIQGTLPDELFGLQNLKYLDLSYCNINGTLPNFLGKAPKLQYLNLDGNKLSGTFPIVSNLGYLQLNSYEMIYVASNSSI